MADSQRGFSEVSDPQEASLVDITRPENTPHARGDLSSEISVDRNDGESNNQPSSPRSTIVSEDSIHLSSGLAPDPPAPRQPQPCESDDAAPSCNERLWISPWLRKVTLVTFAGAFTAMWATLIILWRYTLQKDGFAITLSTNHYSWTYGPTAILTVISTLWRRVDYHCKLTQPWKEMKRGPVDSSKSLLLDYISPIQVTTFYKAVRNRHWETTLSVLVYALLKVAMLLSTGLLVSSPTSFSCTIPLTVDSKFDTSEFWRDVNSEAWVSEDPSVPAYRFSYPKPVSDYEGVLTDKIKEPLGIRGNVAFQTFNIPAVMNNLTQVSAMVDAFIPNISCEVSRVEFPYEPRGGNLYDPPIALALDSLSCSMGHFTKSLSVELNPYNNSFPYWYTTFNIMRVNCSEAQDILTRKSKHIHIPLDENVPYDLRLAFVAVNYTFSKTNPPKTAATICKFDYNIQKVESTLDLSTGSFQLDISNDSSRLQNLTGIQLGEIIFTLFYNDGSPKFNDLIIESRHDQPTGPEVLFDAEFMADRAHDVLTGVIAQLAHQRWVVADNGTINGTGVCNENRLHIQPTSLWGMIGVLITTSVLPFIMVLLNAGGVISLNPSLISAHAVILACSPSLEGLLARVGSLRTSELTKWLDGHIFKSAFDRDGRFQIVAVGSSPIYHKLSARRQPESIQRGSDLEPEDVKVKKGTWLPLVAGYPFLSLTFTLPILVIAALEALYQVSQHNQGLAGGDYVSLPYVQYATSFVVLVIATTFNSVGFTIQSFSPFGALSIGTTSADRSILNNFLDDIPPVALYRAVRVGSSGAALSIIASTIGSALTIVSSGLWVLRSSIPITYNIKTSPTTTWQLQWENSTTDDGGAATLLHSIEIGATTSPEGIWGDLVFPDLGDIEFLDDNAKSKLGNVSAIAPANFSFTVPALRPRLVCDVVPARNIHLEVLNYSEILNSSGTDALIGIDSRADLPNGCLDGPLGYRDYFLLNDSTMQVDTRRPYWKGSLFDVSNTFAFYSV
ncbi:hypothetical protein F5Y10DRAFT_289328 [Nemania abortiva]|nr:hypothetical protein F5Y10DRAFT_289328 [Nemania abortiva]